MENDPLVIVKFHETETGQIVDMKLMVDHDDIFGAKSQKYNPAELKALKIQLDQFVQEADTNLLQD